MLIGSIASEYGVLPSVVVWGASAMEDRDPVHLAFDAHVLNTTLAERKRLRKEPKPKRAGNGMNPGAPVPRGA